MNYDFNELKQILEYNYHIYNTLDFIETDPIQIPHSYIKKEDIEISAFLASTIAWGRRDLIIRSAKRMMQLMDNAPFEFVINATKNELKRLETFVHRTFNSIDFIFFIEALQNIYLNHGGLQSVFYDGYKLNHSIDDAMIHFRNIFFEIKFPERTQKHIADVNKKAAAKRLNLFLMWLVRHDNIGVHFGLWKNISPADLLLPLDLHTANMSRYLGLLERKQNDWLAVEEVTSNLRKFDPNDPTKYDFAIFGLDLNLKKEE